jgi:hypothetical protein
VESSWARTLAAAAQIIAAPSPILIKVCEANMRSPISRLVKNVQKIDEEYSDLARQ